MHISPYEHGNIFNKDPLRTRKLLLNKREINKLVGYINQKGFSLVPIKLYFKNNRLVGFLLIGNVKNAGIYTNILRNNIDINEVDLPVLEKEPSLFAFSKNYRRKILGGVV